MDLKINCIVNDLNCSIYAKVKNNIIVRIYKNLLKNNDNDNNLVKILK